MITLTRMPHPLSDYLLINSFIEKDTSFDSKLVLPELII